MPSSEMPSHTVALPITDKISIAVPPKPPFPLPPLSPLLPLLPLVATLPLIGPRHRPPPPATVVPTTACHGRLSCCPPAWEAAHAALFPPLPFFLLHAAHATSTPDPPWLLHLPSSSRRCPEMSACLSLLIAAPPWFTDAAPSSLAIKPSLCLLAATIVTGHCSHHRHTNARRPCRLLLAPIHSRPSIEPLSSLLPISETPLASLHISTRPRHQPSSPPPCRANNAQPTTHPSICHGCHQPSISPPPRRRPSPPSFPSSACPSSPPLAIFHSPKSSICPSSHLLPHRLQVTGHLLPKLP